MQEVRRIVLAILEANNLGSLKAPDRGSFVPTAAQESIQQDGADANWDPDSLSSGIDMSVDRSSENVSSRSWNLLVVNDSSIVNAAAGHGEFLSIGWSLTVLAKVPTYCKETSLYSLVSFQLRRTIKAWLPYLAMVSVAILQFLKCNLC